MWWGVGRLGEREPGFGGVGVVGVGLVGMEGVGKGAKKAMKKDDIFKWVLLIGGAVVGYWYVTNYGPNGAVFDSNGNAIAGAQSWWQTWFGGTVAVAGGTTATGTTTGGGTASTTGAPTSPVLATSTITPEQASGAPPVSALTTALRHIPSAGTLQSSIIQSVMADSTFWTNFQAAITGAGYTAGQAQETMNFVQGQLQTNPGYIPAGSTIQSVEAQLLANAVSQTLAFFGSASASAAQATTPGGAPTTLQLAGVGDVVPVTAVRSGSGVGGLGRVPVPMNFKWRN